MNERREPTISAYSPSKEDSSRPQGSQAGGKSPRPQQKRSSANSPAARPVVTKSRMAPFAFLVALIAVGASGFSYWQLMNAQKLLASADLRIAALESKFEMSDDETTASAQTMQAKLKWADSEIRKLWGVAYDTNRKAIESNKSSIAKAAQVANSAKSTVDAKVKKLTQSLGGEISLVSELVDAQQNTMTAIETQNQQLTRDNQTLVDKLNILDSNRKELERRIQTNEHAIEAIDAFRRNVNQQLLQIQGG